jgi:hypothetical protein
MRYHAFVATDRTQQKLVTLTMSEEELNTLVDVLQRCSEDFCDNRRQNALDLRMQFMRIQALRDAAVEAPFSPRHESTRIVEVTSVDPRYIPDSPLVPPVATRSDRVRRRS